MPTLNQTLKEFDKFRHAKSIFLKDYDEYLIDITPALKDFISTEIKTALESVRQIELAPDEKTIKDLEELENKSQAFGYGQAFVCSRLDKNIENYLKN